MPEVKKLLVQGQVIFVIMFVLFQLVFWSVGLVENFAEKDVGKLTQRAEYYENLVL